jgi:hypothetical protein
VYDRARQAIEAGDFDLGFELVESDWKLKFPQADPQLAEVEQQALEQARARQVLLAAAAPRDYTSPGAAGQFEFDDDPGGGGGEGFEGSGVGGIGGSGRGSRGGGGSRDYVVRSNRRGGSGGGDSESKDEFGDADGEGGDGSAADSVSRSGGGGAGSGLSGVAATGGSASNATDGIGGSEIPSGGSGGGNAPPRSSVSGNTAAVSGNAGGPGGAFGGGGGGGGPANGVGDKNLVPDGFETQQSGSFVAGSQAPANSRPSDAAPDPRSERERIMSAEHRGKDWALRNKPPQSVPVRRSIRVSVQNDQLAIMPDSGPTNPASTVIKLPGDTVESIDEFVKQVRDHIDGWGIAGNGLYWRPVVLLNVAPDGQRRADDLARLLKNSGLDVRRDETAQKPPQGSAHETR